MVAEGIVKPDVAELALGPVQLYAGDEALDEAFNTIGSPTQTTVSVAVTEGAAGAPGLVIL